MQQFDVIIIGSGIGGLVCGNLLALEGLRVGVLEKNRQIGGCLQTFSRDKRVFDSGVHYIGGLDKGQNLHQIFKYLGIMDKLKLEKMDEAAFDMVMIGHDGQQFPLAQGYGNFIDRLAAFFPEEKSALARYCETVQTVCKKFSLYNLRSGGERSEKKDVLQISAKDMIESFTANRTLQAVLAGNNILYAGQPDKTPFYIHALVVNSYIESSWKCIGGGSQIAKLLSQNIRRLGGAVLARQEVTQIIEQDGRAAWVELRDGSRLSAPAFISGLHPAKTMEMLQSSQIRPAYRRRMKNLENSISCFSVHVVLKKNRFRYFKHNYYWQAQEAAWSMQNYTEENWPKGFALFLSPAGQTKQYAETLSLLTYMRYEELNEWTDTFNTDARPSERGSSYDDFKERKAKILLDSAARIFPELKACIHSYSVATPLSYRDYLGTDDGSLYGIVKDYHDPVKTLISVQTKLPNLFLTGQNLNLHGILGASITALSTCHALLGNEHLVDKIRHA